MLFSRAMKQMMQTVCERAWLDVGTIAFTKADSGASASYNARRRKIEEHHPCGGTQFKRNAAYRLFWLINCSMPLVVSFSDKIL